MAATANNVLLIHAGARGELSFPGWWPDGFAFADFVPEPDHPSDAARVRWRIANWGASAEIEDVKVLGADDASIVLAFKTSSFGCGPVIDAMAKRHPELGILHQVDFGLTDTSPEARMYSSGAVVADLVRAEALKVAAIALDLIGEPTTAWQIVLEAIHPMAAVPGVP